MEGCDYEVFLSFRGPDTRMGFTDHLYTSLTDAGVRTCRDDEDLRVGEEIGPDLLGAIEQSKISIPIFSKSYASSKWCLKELAQMVESRKRKGQVIMPIFYHVQPSEVRNQTGGYGEALLVHENKKRVDDESIRKWRAALNEVGGLKGWHIENVPNRHEGKLIKEVVTKVLSELKKAYLVVSDFLVGVDNYVKEVEGMLGTNTDDVKIVGIYGMGGIGKTTLAKVVYNKLSRDFADCCFLADVRETSHSKGIVFVQNQLISNLSKKAHPGINSKDEGIMAIEEKFSSKKVLILLDDVDEKDQLTALLGRRSCFGLGSRILITTRKVNVLREFGVKLIYLVGGLDLERSLQLFSMHAFRSDHPPIEKMEQSREIVKLAEGLPLTLEVMGSTLSTVGQRKEKWDDYLAKWNKGIKSKLMISYDVLDLWQRQLFLDIACLFDGYDLNMVLYMWKDCDLFTEEGIEILLLMSLIKIRKDNKLWMHDQLKDLGREIVYQESRGELNKQSRLWNHKDALDVLWTEKGTGSVEAVLLKFDSRSQCSFGPAHFASMSSIRFLRLDQANLEGNFERLLSNLRWLQWQGCPWNLGAENLDLKRLVILDLSWSKVNERWNGWSEIKKAENLKVLNLTGCVDLIRTPDLSYYKSLERLILENCIRLVEISSSLKSLQCLVSLNLRFCTQLNQLPEELGVVKSLEELLIDGTAVQEIPASIGNLQNLGRFSACNCLSLIQLPESMSHVKSLSILALNGTKIAKLPLSIGELGVLQHLSINLCWSILKLPMSLGTLASLIELDLSSTGIVELPNTINELYFLRVLKIDFTFVRELPCAIWKLKWLEELHASRCRSLDGEIPRDIEELSELRVLRLGYSRIRGLPDSICRLSKLRTLDLLHCDKLCKVPKLPSTLISLSISSKLMDTVPDISSLVKLEELFLADGSQELVLPHQGQIEAIGCTYLVLKSLLELKILQLSLLKIQLLPVGLDQLHKLTKLSLCCIHMEELPDLPSSLFTLSLRHYKSLKGLPDLSYLKLLSEFELLNCAVTEVPGLWKFESLRVFRISHCNLKQLLELENLISLASLNVSFCQSLERLPNLLKLENLKDIKIKGCPTIPDIRSMEHLNSFENPSSAIIEVESSSEVESSKLAIPEHSSIQGVKRKCKADFQTDMATSERDDGNGFPVDDEDNILERKKNKPSKSIASAISDKPSLPPKAQAKSSESDNSSTETMGGSSNLQSSPSVGGSSTTWARANVKLLTSSFLLRLTLSMLILYFFLAVASKFNRQLIFRTKPTHSFPYESDLFDVKPDKDSSLSVDLTGTKTTGISPTTEQGDMPSDRASTVPSLATIVPALPPPAARPKPSSAADEDRAPIDAEADLYGDDVESLFLKIESLLSDDSGKQNTGAGMSRSSQSDLQAYQKASQEVENIMSQGLLAIMFNPKLLGYLQELLNYLLEHKTPEVPTFGHVYLKLQHFLQSAGDFLSSQRKILIECERFEREFKKEKNFLEYDKDEVLLLEQQIEETAKSVADNEQFIAKLQAEIEAHKLQLKNAKSELSSLLTKRSEKVKELKSKFKQVLSMKSENPSMEKKRNQAQETIGKINVEWNELYADIKG